MAKPKYKLKIQDIERHGGVAKLERDGFNRETIIKEMYKQTDGASTRQREEIVSRLYDRQKPC